MTDSIAAILVEMNDAIPDGSHGFGWWYTKVKNWKERLAALSPAGSGLTANSKPVAWRWWTVRGEAVTPWANMPVKDWAEDNGRIEYAYLAPPPSVDVGKLRELVATWRSDRAYTLRDICADELDDALNAAGAKA